MGGSSSLHDRSGEDSNKEGGGEGEDMNTSRGPGLKRVIDDDLFSDYESPVVAKKSKPDDSSTYSGSFCLSECKSLSSHPICRVCCK